MANYLLAFRGGSMPETEAEQQQVMTRWMDWFGALGEAVVDAGSPFGPSSTIDPAGKVSGAGASGLTGYSIISAASIAEACEKAKGCPLLGSGGSIDVYEAAPMG